MDLYHIWCDLKPGVSDIALGRGAAQISRSSEAERRIESWRLTRRKLGLGAAGIGEFHIIIETKDLAQLEPAFQHVSSRREPVEGLHFGVNSLVQNADVCALSRFSRPHRHFGEEKF